MCINVAEQEKYGHINIEQFYDYETNSYLKNFGSPEAQKNMKKLHIDYFTKQEENAERKSSFYESREKSFLPRPASLAKDQRTTFIQVRSKSKLFPLFHLYEFLDAQNCWASSRYEYGYIMTIYYELPVLKYWWFIPYWSFEVKTYDVT